MQPRTLAEIIAPGRRLEWLLEIASAIAYAASLVLPAIGIVQVGGDVYPGHFLLVWGIFAVTGIGHDESLFFNLAWFANAAFANAHVSLLQRSAPRACAFAAAGVVLSASFSLVRDTSVQGMCIHHPIKLYAGYIVWVASMLLGLASAVVALRETEGPDFLRRRWRAAMWIAFISLSYVIFGTLLPPGKCGLLP